MRHGVLVRRLFHRGNLEIIGKNDAGDPTLRLSNAIGTINEVPHLGWCRRRLNISASHVLEEGLEIKILLVMRSDRRASLLSNDGEHRLMVKLCVIEAVQKMDGARTGGGDTDTDLPRELCFGTGHQAGHLLMPYLNEVDSALCLCKGADQASDPVAWIA